MFDVDSLLSTFGLAGILIIIFMETGVLIGFIFPGDTLLFTAGIMAASDTPFAPLWALCLFIPLAAAVGDQVGYTLGRRYGAAALESRVLNWIGPDAVTRTEGFFARYGAFTVLIARFIAVVRTLAPLVAGIAKMPRAVFTLWSVIGCFAWGAGITVLGYLLGGIPFIRDYLDLIIIVGVSAVLIPVAVKVVRMRLHARRERREMPGRLNDGGE
ncbi:DedA family protein [uncultured Corynebacterium sp.]|uniref:DedA family protein n=1 Tax=uncultured Corynebacterium sp. TaxID=159447 RepID=UPI0025FFB5ED|nr:DedA family protein [uncultured Corynebacterium sp.]